MMSYRSTSQMVTRNQGQTEEKSYLSELASYLGVKLCEPNKESYTKAQYIFWVFILKPQKIVSRQGKW